jgi:hypothetical protein
MTWDSQCPCCSKGVAKAPIVTVIAFGLPFCQPCIETHFPKLDAALKAWHRKYPDLTQIAFRKALKELSEATGQNIPPSAIEYGIVDHGDLVL